VGSKEPSFRPERREEPESGRRGAFRIPAFSGVTVCFFGGILALLVLIAPGMSGAATADRPIVVASKIDTEGALLGNMILALFEARHIPVESRLQLGPTNIVRAALLAGQIDLYPEYTGNGAFFFHRETDPAWKDRARGYDLVKRLDNEKNQLVWLNPAPADNTWVIAVRRDLAEKARLKSLDDLAVYLREGGRLKLAASAEFVESPAALPAFEKTYGFRLSDRQLLTLSGGNTAATLRAAAEGMSGVNAAMAYGTDGALAALGLVALEDNKHAQIVYAPAPVVRAATVQRYSQIPAALDPAFATLTRQILQRLNAKIAVEGEDAKAVAVAYLRSRHLLP
jgi:osmoprotectant transport system substrate-binding protein